MCKNKIIILMPAMPRGGTEISLLNFLSAMNFEQYEVTLLLLEISGELLSNIPKEVKVKSVYFENKSYLEMARQRLQMPFLRRQLSKLAAKTKFFTLSPYGYKEALRDCSIDSCFYDLAIDYHGYGCFCLPLLIEKVHARKKICVVHGDNLYGMKNVYRWLEKLDCILEVTDACRKLVQKTFPKLHAEHCIMPNILDYENIRNRSVEDVSLKIREDKGILLCTVGRMEYEKGFDIAVEVGRILHNQKITFTWLFVGDGSEYQKIKENIKSYGLMEHFVLLGMQKNPYPYMRIADLYVQPSRNEGYGLAIAESIAIGTPVVATDLPAIREHLPDGIVGKLVTGKPENFANIIVKCIKNPTILDEWHHNLKIQNSRSDENNKTIVRQLIIELLK